MNKTIGERKYFFTDEMNETLRAMWDSNIKDRVKILAENWNMPEHAIKNQVSKLGLARLKPLTHEEKRIILNNSHLPVDRINKILREKGYRRKWGTIDKFLKSSRRYIDNTNYYTLEDLMDGFGVNRETVDLWRRKKYLKSTDGGHKLLFLYEDVRKFIKMHYEVIDFAKIETLGFKSWFMEFLVTDGQKVPHQRENNILSEMEMEIIP